MERHPQLIPIGELIKGRLYLLDCRNLSVGVYDGNGGFIGIRYKFGSRFLFTEFHWDRNEGTVCYVEDTKIDIPDNIAPLESLGTIDAHSRKPVYFNQEKSGWSWDEKGEVDNSIRPCCNMNEELFNWLDELGSRK